MQVHLTGAGLGPFMALRLAETILKRVIFNQISNGGVLMQVTEKVVVSKLGTGLNPFELTLVMGF